MTNITTTKNKIIVINDTGEGTMRVFFINENEKIIREEGTFLEDWWDRVRKIAKEENLTMNDIEFKYLWELIELCLI